MDGWSIQDPPHYNINQVYTKEKYEKKKRDKVVSPPKRRVSTSDRCFDVEVDP